MQLDLFKPNVHDSVVNDCRAVLINSTTQLNDFVRPLLAEVEYAMTIPITRAPISIRSHVVIVQKTAIGVAYAYRYGSQTIRYGYQIQSAAENFRIMLHALYCLARHRSGFVYPSLSSSETEGIVREFSRVLHHCIPESDDVV